MNIIIFGPQGSGKGTQAEKLAEKFNLAHIETGQIFREISREDSDLGRKVFDIINVRKELIPDEVTIEVIKSYAEKVPAEKGIILDSAPRTIGQLEPLEKMLENIGRSIDHGIYIALPYEESIGRISKRFYCSDCRKSLNLGKEIQSPQDVCPVCGGPVTQREDDTPEGIAKRLDIFYSTTVPVIEEFRRKGLLVEVDGNQGVEEVFEKIISNL